MKTFNCHALAASLFVILFATSPAQVQAIQIGPGASLPGATNADGPGGRTNMELDFVTLQPGTYAVSDFEFNAVNTSGTVQPFLALLTSGSPRQYTPIWVGPLVAPGTTGMIADIYPAFSQIFTLAAAANIYVGFTMSGNAVGFANGGLVDHNGTPFTPVVGVQTPTFSNYDLPRSYAFAVNLSELPPIPEPTTFTLLGLGLLGMIRRQRRSRRLATAC